MKYTCKMKKSDIVNAIVAEYEKAKAMYDKSTGEFAFGMYMAMEELLSVIKVYEED